VEDTLAERLGVQKHDVIVKVNGQSIASADDVARALKGAKDGKVAVEVVRKGERKTLEASK
jgi:S1-C subfamily serine protease